VANERELSIQAIRDPRGWLVIHLMLPLIPRTRWRLDVMLNSGRPQSVISRTSRDRLVVLDLLRHESGDRYRLAGAEADGQPLPDFPLRLSAGPALLGVEGMLGLDFFDQFVRVCLDTDPLLLTLLPR